MSWFGKIGAKKSQLVPCRLGKMAKSHGRYKNKSKILRQIFVIVVQIDA